MFLLIGCEKSGLLDYRNRFTGIYNCTAVEVVTHPTMTGSDTTETLTEREVIQVIKVEDTNNELYILGKRVNVGKDGTGTTDVNTGASYVNETYTVSFSEKTMTITRKKNGANFTVTTNYFGVKI